MTNYYVLQEYHRTDKVPFYDLADEDYPEEERSRAPLLILIALIMLAAFAGVVGLAYTGASLAITALEGPVRVATPEAAPAPTGINGYNEPVSPAQEAKAAAPALQSAAKVEPPPIRLNQVAPTPRPTQAGKAETPPIRLSQAAPPAPAKAATPAVPSAAPSAAASRAVSGAAVLQLGAFDSQQLADGAWARFRARYPSFAGLSRDVQRADLGKKGIMYRLRVGPFANRAAATNACVELKAAGANCFVAAP
jgi:cell division septation protein DedD